MAYDSNNLSALTYANGFTLWHYKTKDLAEKTLASGYFHKASSMLRIGDAIMINAPDESVSFFVKKRHLENPDVD